MVIITKKQTKPRAENDFYETPIPLAETIVDRFAFLHRKFLDPGAGTGTFGYAVRSMVKAPMLIDGIDIVNRNTTNVYDNYVIGDYLNTTFSAQYDCVIGNPPYALAEEFIRKSMGLLIPGGSVIFLLKLAFLEGKKRSAGLFTEMPPAHVSVLAGRPSFDGSGKTNDYAFAVFIWEKKKEVVARQVTTISWLQWN